MNDEKKLPSTWKSKPDRAKLPGNLYASPSDIEKDTLTVDSPDQELPSTWRSKSDREVAFGSYSARVQDIIQKKKEEIREVYEDQTGEKYITDEEKEARVNEIDATISKLKDEQRSVADRPRGENIYKQYDLPTIALMALKDRKIKRDDIKYLSDEIIKLDIEKKKLVKEITPVTAAEIKDVENNYGLVNMFNDSKSTFRDLAIIEKYGIPHTQKIYNKVINNKLDEKAKIKLKHLDPETIMSYDNLITEKQPKLKFIDQGKLDKIWSDVTADPKYSRAMYDKKRKILYDGIKDAISDNENIIDKDVAAQNILGNMLVKFAQAEDGNFSIEGWKLFAEYHLDRINTALEWNRASLGPLISKRVPLSGRGQLHGGAITANQQFNKLVDQYGKETVKQWYQTVSNDAFSLGQTKDILEQMLKMPEAKHGIRDAGKAFKSLSATDFMYGVGEMMEAVDITRTVKKAERGESLTYGEEISMMVYATSNYVDQFDTKGTWYKAIHGAAVMAPYVAEFVMTGGFFEAARIGTRKLVAPITRKYIGKYLPRVADITAENIARASGAFAQSVAMPQMYIKHTAENIRSDVVLAPGMDDITYKILENTGDPFLKGAAKGFASTYTEMAFERMGTHMMKALPGTFKLAAKTEGKLTGTKFVEKKVIDNWMKLKNITSIESASKYVTRHHLGWDGIMGEYLEELGTYFVEQKIQGQPLFGDNFWNDQLTTFMTVGIFGLPMKMFSASRSYLVGNDMLFTGIDQKTGEEKKIGIPKDIWEEFSVDFLNKGEGLYDADKLTELIDKHKDRLNAEQLELLFSVTITNGQKRMVDLVKKQGAEKKKKEEPVLGYDPRVFHEEEPPIELSVKEKKEIKKENKKIVKEHPDLARLELLIQDPATGQYVEPSKNVIEELYNQVRKEWADKAEVDEFGNAINLTSEVEKLSEQKDILEEYSDKMQDLETEFKDLAIPAKHKRIALELKKGEKITGTLSLITDRKQQVKLKDGRTVDIFLETTLDKNEREKVNKAILNNEEIELKLQPYEEWNLDTEGGIKYYDASGLPYWDRIQAFLGDLAIGAVQVYDYAEEGRKRRDLEEKESEIVESLKNSTADFFEALAGKTGGIKKIISDDERDELGKKFVVMLRDAGDWTGIKVEQIMQKVMEWINKMTHLSAEERGFLAALARENEEMIKKTVIDQQLKAKGFKKRIKEIKIDDLVLPEVQGIAPTGSYKLDILMQGYAPVWRNIADKLGTTKEIVEKRMYKIAHQEGILGYLQNEAIFNEFLNTLSGTDRVTDAIVDILRQGTLSSAVSLIDVYHNTYLGKQYGYLIQEKHGVLEITQKLLNPSESYDEFVDRFWNQIERYEITGGYTGYDAVKRRISIHNKERDDRFNSKNQNWVWYDSQTPEKREELRREQHESDVQLLAEFTGISTDMWHEYFKKQTKETLASSDRNTRTLTEYGTYDNLLKHDTWRTGYRRIQSNIGFNLSLLPTVKKEGQPRIGRSPEEFELAMNEYFLQGNEDAGTLSNLYKLSTAITNVDDIGQSGIDIKGDRFNSFVQSSNVSDIAHNILESNVDNHIVRYYKELGKPMELIFINGLHNLDLNSDKKGTHNVNLSNEDIWMIQMFHFLEEGDTYLHWVAQFGDKPTLTFVEIPKISAPTKEQYDEFIEQFPDFNDAVSWFLSEYLEQKQDLFSSLFKSLSFNERKEKRREIAKSFVYNFARSMTATNELFFGEEKQYENLVDMVKRGGSSNSPGYKMNPFVEGGVGETFQFAMVNDLIGGVEIFDGFEVMSGEDAERCQVSMGSGLSKINEPGYEILSSIKTLTSFIDDETNLRGHTKANRVNIELLANDFPGSKFEHIRDFMRKNSIDVLSFTSGTKKHEKVVGKKNKNKIAIQLWDNKTGELLKNPVIPEFGIVTRKTKNVYVQQDLRHSSKAKATKMPSQLLASTLILNNGPAISQMINQLQGKIMYDMVKEFDGKPLDETKLKWLKENVNENTQPEIYRLLEAGITAYEPALANYMRKMLAGALTRKALEVPINRLTTQEIPDPGGLLNKRKPYKDKNGVDRILLPDIAANVWGARYENSEYKGKPEKAKEFVIANQELHRDLFDVDGNFMEWTIDGRDGIIPGEYIISTRVPVSGLHSHTVGRLKNKVSVGNFTILDAESRLVGGSDFDGDQRFNQVFFRGKTGKIILDDTKEGIANRIMMAIAKDYTDPAFNERILSAIDTDKYNSIVDKHRDDKVYSFIDPRGLDKARNENMVGVFLKGAFTDVATVYGLLASRNIEFKKPINIPIGKKTISLTGFVRDPIGLIQTHFANFLNMAFDNAADPKLEIAGINEHTVNMFAISLLGNKNLDTTSDKAIMDHIEQIVEYFTSPILRRFTQMMRRDNGGLREANLKRLEERLGREFTASEARKVIDFYKLSRELSELRRFYSLTQRISGSIIEFEADKALYNAIANNDKTRFKFINVKNLFNDKGVPVEEFLIAEQALDAAERYIYSDTFNNSVVGKQILAKIKDRFQDKKYFTQNELKSIDYGINNIVTIKVLGIKQSASSIEKDLIANLNEYRKKYPGNEFLRTVSKVIRKGKYYIEIAPDYRQGKIGELKLARIREDFDSLWKSKEGTEIVEKFVANAMYKWGATTSTFGGSYYSLFGDKFRTYYSILMQNELNAWQLDEISSVEKLRIMEWILRGSKLKDLRKKAFNPSYANYYDYNSLADLDTPVSYEALDALTGVTNANEFAEYNKTHEFDKHAIAAEVGRKYDKPMLSIAKDVIPVVADFIGKFQERALRLFPPAENNRTPVKDMLPENAIGEALASEDSGLQKFIYDRLKKMYPEVQFFTDKDAFFAFVKKWGNNGFNISPHAIGHAFANAIFINTEEAVQSTHFHENSHIYWDALPKDHIAKKKLLELYQKEYPQIFDIEEQIILDIGRAGVNLANIEFKGSLLDKFILHLKAFWRAVKAMFGIYSDKDLIDQLTWSIWKNSDNIVTKTNRGNAIVRSMISYNFENDQVPGFNGEKHIHTIGGKPIPSMTTTIQIQMSEAFNPEIMAHAKALKEERMYHGITREHWDEDEIGELSSSLVQFWDAGAAEKGTAMHTVGEAVFNDTSMSEEFIKDNFINRDVYIKLKKIYQEIKSDILREYPYAIFYTEQQLISKKYEIGGIADLIVDTGNRDKEGRHELILIDFKTTDMDKPYADEDMNPLDDYKKPFNMFKAPFQNLVNSKYTQHTLQLNMYGNTIEEQSNPKQPGEKNKIIRLRIIPIRRSLDETKKVTDVKPSNWVNIARNKRSIEIADQMMQQSFLQRQNIGDIYPEYKKVLVEAKIFPALIANMLKAMHFMNLYTGNIKKINKNHVDNIRTEGIKTVLAKLIASKDAGGLEYKMKDIHGPESLSSEELYYISRNDIHRDEYFEEKAKGEKNRFFFEQEVGARYTAVPNPDKSKRKWHRYGDKLIQDVGYKNVEVGDKLMMIYNIPRPDKTRKADIYFYEVLEIDTKRKKVKLRNEETGKEDFHNIPGPYDGLTKLHSKLPSGIEDPGPESYKPAYLYEKEEIMEKHWKTDFKIGEFATTQQGELERNMKSGQTRFIWRFFNKYGNWALLEEFCEDERNILELYEQLEVFDNKISEDLIMLIREESVNHWMSGIIRRENKQYDKVPTEMLPMTLNVYYILTNHRNQVWSDYDRAKPVRTNMPARMHEHKYIPQNLFTSQLQTEHRKYIQKTTELNFIFKEFSGKVDYSIAIVNIKGGLYWRRPLDTALVNHDIERKFVEEVYKYYALYDPAYRDMKKQERSMRIEVSNIYMSQPEFVKKFGSKHGSMMYTKLKPAEYDSMRLEDIEKFDRNGKVVYKKDKKGRPIIRTLGQIKEEFAIQNLDTEEIKEQLGSKFKHIFLRIPGTPNVVGRIPAGILDYQINKAIKIFDGKKDSYNLTEAVKRGRKRISVMGCGDMKFTTELFLEAEEKAIDSMIKAHYMKRLMAPLDWMLDQYEADRGTGPGKTITKYLRNLGEYLLYGIKPEQSFLGGRMISDIVDTLNRANSFCKIVYSPATQVNNLAIGQALDFVREPAAWMKGIKRLFEGGKLRPNAVKAAAILNRHELATIVSDVLFDQIDKEIKLLGVDITWFEKWGYWPMEFVEKLNQFTVFVGLMTDKEWNAYNMKGLVINPSAREHMTDFRAQNIKFRAQDIHGDYGTSAMAPFWVENVGKAIMPFKKWLPAMVWATFAPYHIDQSLAVRSGLLPTFDLARRVIQYNIKSVEKRQKIREELIQKEIDDENLESDAFFNYTDEYFNELIKQSNSGKVTWKKDLSSNDKRNIHSLAKMLVMTVMGIITRTALLGGDDDKRYIPYSIRLFAAVFERFQGDVFFVYGFDNWTYMLENIIPSIQLVISMGKFIRDSWYWVCTLWNPSMNVKARYQKETPFAKQGLPKFMIDATYFVPAGSAFRWMQKRKRIFVKRHINKIDLRDYGVDLKVMRELGFSGFIVSEQEIEEAAYKYKRVFRDVILSGKYDALIESGMEASDYLDLKIGESLQKAEYDEVKKALKMMYIDQMLEFGTLGTDIETVKENSKAWRDIEDARKPVSKKKQKERFDEAMEKYK